MPKLTIEIDQDDINRFGKRFTKWTNSRRGKQFFEALAATLTVMQDGQVFERPAPAAKKPKAKKAPAPKKSAPKKPATKKA